MKKTTTHAKIKGHIRLNKEAPASKEAVLGGSLSRLLEGFGKGGRRTVSGRRISMATDRRVKILECWTCERGKQGRMRNSPLQAEERSARTVKGKGLSS